MIDEPLADSIKMQVRCDDMVVVKQKQIIGLHRVDGYVSSNPDANVVLIEVDDLAAGRFVGISLAETSLR